MTGLIVAAESRKNGACVLRFVVDRFNGGLRASGACGLSRKRPRSLSGPRSLSVKCRYVECFRVFRFCGGCLFFGVL